MSSKLSKKLVFGLSLLLTVAFVNCKGNKGSDENQTEENSGIQAKTAELTIFAQMPMKGDQQDYFSISGPNDSQTVKMIGTPNENSNSGTVKITIDVKVLKPFKDEIYQLGSYRGFELQILDEDREEITSFSMGDTDKELLIAELSKPTPGTVSLIFKDDYVYENSYNKLFSEGKYVRLDNVNITGKTEHDKEMAKMEAESSSSSNDRETRYNSAAGSSNVSDDSDDDSDDTYKHIKDKAKDLQEKAKEKTKDLQEKAKEKTKDLKDKAKEKLNEWLDN